VRAAPRREELAGRPRFRDLDPAEASDPDINPYLVAHREFGRELLPAGEAWKHRGAWGAFFGRMAPLVAEVGAGIGDWLVARAAAAPEADHVGIELRYKRTVLIARRIRVAGVRNAVAVRYHASFLDDLFDDSSLDAIWLNHPDPWPRERHEKHRLVSEHFLADCARLLRPGGAFNLRTDADHHVAALEALLPSSGFALVGRAWDLAVEPPPWGPDTPTHYQKKMAALGRPVHAVALQRVGPTQVTRSSSANT
jgi:tRNA (guanine-N7-)-methyltransferase